MNKCTYESLKGTVFKKKKRVNPPNLFLMSNEFG